MLLRQLVRVLAVGFIVTFVAATTHAQLFWNQAADFSATDSYVAIPSSAFLNPITAITIEMWVVLPGGGFDTFLDKGFSSNYSFGTTNANVLRFFKNGVSVIGTDVVPVGQWTHVAVTCNATTGEVRTYINGIAADTLTIATGNFGGGTDSLRIGTLTNFGNDFSGLMDEVRVWDRVLFQAEIQRNFRTSLGASEGVYNRLALSTTFQDDESSGALFSLADWSGNGNNGVNRGVVALDMSNGPSRYLSFNEAIDCDGTDDYLAGADNAAVSPTTAVTLEAWVYPRVGGTGVVINKGAAANYRLLVYNATNDITAVIAGTNMFGTGTVPQGQWSHIAVTYTASTGAYNFYVNGNPAGSGAITPTPIPDGTDSLLIGGGPGLFNFNGYIDEVRISDYAKTAAEIRRHLYVSIDQSNEPNSGFTNVCYNLDGLVTDACADGGPRLTFNGNTRFSAPATGNNIPVALLNRVGATTAFTDGYYWENSDRRIPTTGTSGTMIRDSVFVGQSVVITDVNLFLAINHTYDGDLDVSLIAPNGDSIAVFTDWFMLGADDNIIGVLDDQAESTFVDFRFTAIGPRIKPENNLNTLFSGDNAQGWWILHIVDDVGGDTGRVYAWGVQINNQTTVTGVEETGGVPLVYTLEQNYPNPFNPATTIRFSIPKSGQVRLKVFDILGREVATLLNDVRDAGNYEVPFDARMLASGTYFYRLETAGFVETKKMLLLK